LTIGFDEDRTGMTIYHDTPGVNTQQLFVIEGGRASLRVGKGIGEGK